MIFHRLFCHRCHQNFVEKTPIAKCRLCGRIIKANYYKESKMKDKVYIAASYTNIVAAKRLGIKLAEEGFDILSYWHIDGNSPIDSDYHSGSRAIRDYHSVERCDLFIELIGDNGSKGGRHCELGLALAWGKKIMLVGEPDDCIFTWLPWLPRFDTAEDLLKRLKV